MSDYDKQQWQAEQAARDAALEKQRDKFAKARERSARNAKRKLERLKQKLTDEGEISEFEGEFAESVLERIEEFGAAFADPQLGRPGDALSAAQKRVVAGMNRKAKELRKAAKAERLAAQVGGDAAEADAPDELSRPGRERRFDDSSGKPRYSSFKSKKTPKFAPRVRQLDDDFEADDAASAPASKLAPALAPAEPEPPTRPPVGKPFLRIVSND